MTWLNVDEAAAYLRVSRATIYNLVSQRRLTSHKIGAKTVFKETDLDKVPSAKGRASL